MLKKCTECWEEMKTYFIPSRAGEWSEESQSGI